MPLLRPFLRPIGIILVGCSTLSNCSNEPFVFGGSWRGSNAQFADVTLALQQFRDSLDGTMNLTFAGFTTPVVTRVSGHVDRINMEVSGPLAPSSGWSSLGFAGHLSVGTVGTLTGHVLLSGTPEPSPITLVRQ